ncbi:MAG TPA: hypothetical protein PK156_49490, partial [Polyangium sp.]|nr:hypothetical protein [Polyangium sp.]
IGAVAVGRTVYVNASWLVAMAAKPAPNDVPTITAPPLVPQKVPGNPYNPPQSITDCATQVESDCSTCVTSGTCSDSDLTDLADPKEACQFLLADSRRTKSLCAIVLFGNGSLRECLSTSDTRCMPPSEATSAAIIDTSGLFESSNPCDFSYDNCLQNAHSYEYSGGVCSVAGSTTDPGRKALMLFGPLAWLLVMSRIGRRGPWKAK